MDDVIDTYIYILNNIIQENKSMIVCTQIDIQFREKERKHVLREREGEAPLCFVEIK